MTKLLTRPAADGDRARCIWIEAGAMPGYSYIDDVWDLFTKTGDGDLTLALEGGVVGGMGKLTHLFGRYCWLESLRVHPDFQNRGLGKAIYRRYMEEMATMGHDSCGMYTGAGNTHSSHLAQLFGLTLRGRFSEYTRPVGAATGTAPAFCAVPEEQGEQVLSAFYGQMGGFLSINRTWYPAAAGLGRHMAARGWLYEHNGTVLVAGGRFQRHKNLYIPFVYGDIDGALAFADALARGHSSAQLSAMRPSEAGQQAEVLLKRGFCKPGEDMITLWKNL